MFCRLTPYQKATKVGTHIAQPFTLQGQVWCNGLHICFPSKHLPSKLDSGFQPQLWLEFSGSSILEFVVKGILQALSSPPVYVDGSRQYSNS